MPRLFLGALTIAGFLAAYVLVFRPQEIRQRAAGCSEAPVNVEFRRYTGKDEPGWRAGSTFTGVIAGDKMDVNCFARNGAALLSGGKFTVKRGGQVYTVPTAALKSATEIRGWTTPSAGTYVFTCSNNAGCSNSDTLVVKPKLSTPPIVPPSIPPAACTAVRPADINKDCAVNIKDYDAFLKDFRGE
jgi:hypothetical protein